MIIHSSNGSEEFTSRSERHQKNLLLRLGRPGNLLRLLLLMMILVLAGSFTITLIYLNSLDSEGISAILPAEDERLNILFMGIDGGILANGARMTGRSDVLILLSIDRVSRDAMLLSIPRDTRVILAGHGEAKINAAHVYGGIPLTITTVTELLEQPIHYYVKLDLQAFQNLVDAVGGVTIDIHQTMQYEDPYDVPPLVIDLQEGQQHLDGARAMQFVRFRDQLGDIGRLGRQKEFVLALMDQVLSFTGIWRLPAIARQAKTSLSSNLSAGSLLSLGYQLLTLTSAPVQETLPGQGINGGAFWLPDTEAIGSLFPPVGDHASLWFSWFTITEHWHDFWADNPLLLILKRDQAPRKEEITITVLNGNGGQGSATRAAENLTKEGYHVISIGDADHYGYAKCLIIYNAAAEGKARVAASSIPGALLQAATADDPESDLVIIIGVDYLR